jgi:hypothetical protein
MKVYVEFKINEHHGVQCETASIADADALLKAKIAYALLWVPETAADIRRGIKVHPLRMWHSDAVADSKAKRSALRAWARYQPPTSYACNGLQRAGEGAK